jgi:autotransporter-associated beta strand protein
LHRSGLAKLALIGALGSSTPLCAQVSGSWLNSYGGTWQNPANWSSNPLTPGGGGVATFGPTTWNTVNVTSVASVSLGTVVINSPSRYSIGSQIATMTFAAPAVFDVTGPAAQSLFGSTITNSHSFSLVQTSAGVVKNGPGSISGINFMATGGTTVNAGTLVVTGNTPFPANPGSLLLNGGAVTVSDSLTFPQQIVIGAGGGILRAGNSGASTLSNSLDGTGSLTIFGFLKNGFSLFSNSSFSGRLNMKGPLTLSGNGALLNVGSIDNADTLTLTSTGTLINNNRVSDTAPITMRGGSIGGSLSLDSTEALGPITLAQSNNAVGGTGISLSTPTITRQNRATLSVGTSLFITSTPPPLSGGGAEGTTDVGILPWARRENIGNVMPVTVGAGGVVRQLDPAEFITSVPTGLTSSNLQLTSSATVASPATVNSLTLNGPSITVSGPSTLSVSSGGVYITQPGGAAGRTTLSAPLDFGSAEGVVHSLFLGTGTMEIDSSISGTSGVTFAANVTVRGTSTYTGQTTIQGKLRVESDVLVGVPGPFGTDNSPVVIEGNTRANGPGITFAPGASSIQFARDIVIHQAGMSSVSFSTPATPAAAPPVIVSGNINLEGVMTASSLTGFGGLQFTGDISGPGVIRGASNVILSGNNSFSGGVDIAGSMLGIGSDTALGTGTLWCGDLPAIRAVGGPRTIANPVVVAFSLGIGGDQDLTLNGPINLFGATKTISIGNTATTTFAGTVYNGGLNKAGPGLLRMNSVGLPTFSVTGGTVQIMQNGTDAGTSFVQALNLNAGVVFDLTDNDLIVDYATISPEATIRNTLIDHRLRSSLADATHGLGYGENSGLGYATFSGKTVDATSVLVKFTYLGDADLDGDVDVNDLGRLATNWQTSGVWVSGDFDYNGTVDVNDLGLLASNWQSGVGSPLKPAHSHAWAFAEALSAIGLPSVPIPEPASALIALSSLLLLRRARIRS